MAKSAIRVDGNNGKVISLAPDVCLTKVGKSVIPIPYMIVSYLKDSKNISTDTGLTKKGSFTMDSYIEGVKGDEPGNKGGIRSGTYAKSGYTYPLTNKSSIKVNGKEVIHDDCIFAMNANAPKGTYNTTGKVYYNDIEE